MATVPATPAIRVMDPHLAAKIAAGEVIERPASVVKELVENAIDAGARTIRVEVEGGGVERIAVIDDGCGMAADQVEVAFRRHATSKLYSEADLDRLHTLGFRGEALPSIAAVADFTCTTRATGERVGVELRIEEGSLDQQPVARQVGTSMVVEHLFARFPARKKFLRARNVEAAACVQTVAPLALAYPEVQFTVLVDGRESLRTPGTGKLMDAAVAVLGAAAAEHLLAVPEATADDERGQLVVAVEGVCATGSFHKPGRTGIYVLVNRRPIQNRSLSFAVAEAYGSLVPVGRQPVAIVNVTVPPAEVDFNVHPSKLEVKLLRERAVYATIQRALRAALGSGEWDVAAWPRDGDVAASAAPTLPESWDHPAASDHAHAADDHHNLLAGGEQLQELRVLGQAGRMYVIAEGDAGVYLVDQHAAHERVLLEELRQALGGRSERQLLLEPLVLDVPAEAIAVVEQATTDLDRLGFTVEGFGPRQVLVRAVPGVLAARQPGRVLADALAAVASNSHGLVVEQNASWAERLALVLACKTAVRAGDTLSELEMQALLRRLGETAICRTCAHGRPTAILLSHAHLEREFGRR